METLKRAHQNRVAHWHEFLRVLSTPLAGKGGEPQRTEPWGDTKAFLASFEQVAEACRWPREEWAARLLPALSGEAGRAFLGLEAKDREDYGKVKSAILHGEALRVECRRQQFRRFRCREAEDPRWVYGQLEELCHQWLKPEKHTKEQILELLVLEQFLASVPPETQAKEWEGGPSKDDLARGFLVNPEEDEAEKWQEPIHEVVVEIEESPADENYKDPEEKDGWDPTSDIDRLSPHSALMVFPSKGQEVADTEPSEGPGNLNSVAFLPDPAGQTTLNSTRTTMYWEVKQDDHRINNFKEGLLIPKPDVFSTQPEPDMIFIQSSSKDQEAFPAPDSGDDVTENLTQFTTIILGKEEDKQNMLSKISQGGATTEFEIDLRGCESTSFPWRQKPEETHDEPSGLVEMCTTAVRPTKPAGFFSPEAEGTYCFKSGLVADQTTQTGGASYQCQVCKRAFPNKSRLTRHQRIHTGEKPYKCAECDKAFSRKDKLVGHQRTHKATKKPSLEAFEFGKPFSIGDTLLQQQPTYSEMRPYRCSECGKAFALSSLLRRHQQIHSAKKPYECSKCRRRFRWISAVRRHEKTHERLFECLECGRTFNQIEALYKHHTIHTGERRYKCSQCGQGFNQRENMLRHEKIHTEAKHPCSGCEKSFSRKDTMMRHQKIHKEENRTIKEEIDYD